MRFGLDRMRRLMTALGSPQERFASIHVVGTNGKSSTARMIAAILERHGLRTGAYLSPHLVSFAERIRVDERGRRRGRFARRGRARAAPRAQRRPDAEPRRPRHAVRGADRRRLLGWRGPASRSRSSRPGWAGAGTRRTSSTSSVQVLTNVGLEHTRWLGPTVADIARREARRGRSRARRSSSAPTCIPTLGRSPRRWPHERGAALVRGPAATSTGVELLARGAFQRRNFALARAAAQALLGGSTTTRCARRPRRRSCRGASRSSAERR